MLQTKSCENEEIIGSSRVKSVGMKKYDYPYNAVTDERQVESKVP